MRQVLIISDAPSTEATLSYGRIHHTAAINAAAHGAWASNASAVYLCQAHPCGVMEEYLAPAIRELPVGSVTDCLRGLEEVKSIYREHSIEATIFVGYQGPPGIAGDASLTVNGLPTRGLGLLATVCQHLGAPVVAVFGSHVLLEEAELWLPNAAHFVIEERLSSGEMTYWPMDDAARHIKESVVKALHEPLVSESLVAPPYEFELHLPGRVQATRPLYFDVQAREHSLAWKTHDFLYGWKVFWTLYAQNFG